MAVYQYVSDFVVLLVQETITRLRFGTTSCIGVSLLFLDTLITFVQCSFTMSIHGSLVQVMIRPSESGIGNLVLVYLF